MKEIFISLILIFTIFYIIKKTYYKNDNLIYEQSLIDNKYYWVRNMKDKNQAANTLAKIKINMNILINYLNEHKNEYSDNMKYIKELFNRTRKIYIMETPEDEKYTSYTINKGEKIVFCLRSKIFEEIHDMNTIMYVVIHEMAHVACPEYGHTKLFKEIFKFLLTEGNKIGIYKITNYSVNPVDYCGMTINEYLFQ